MRKSLFLIIWVSLALTAKAEMNLFSPTGGIPVDITSDDGIEIDRVNKVITALGNAKVVRQDITLTADELIAYYEEDENNNTVFWRLDAKGHLKIVAPEGELTADHGVYDVKQEIIIVYGGENKPITIIGEQGRASAKRQMEYYAIERRIIARGDVEAIQNDQKMQAEIIEIILINQENTQDDIQAAEDISALTGDIEQVRAYNDIILTTADGQVTGDRAIWFAETQKATLTGDVEIRQGQSILKGCRGEVNTQTGSAKLIGGDCESTEGRIKGQFKNDDKK